MTSKTTDNVIRKVTDVWKVKSKTNNEANRNTRIEYSSRDFPSRTLESVNYSEKTK